MMIPKQYLKTIKRTGLGKGLFSEKRYRDDGSDSVNKPAYRKARNPGRRRQFRLRLLARARALGADGFRHPLRDLDHLVRRHILQQLLQERRAADQGVRRRLSTSCSTTPSAAPTPGCRSTSRSRRSAAPMAEWCGSTSGPGLPARRFLERHGLTMRSICKGDKIDRFEQQAKAARAWA